jgi:hypothetical protein
LNNKASTIVNLAEPEPQEAMLIEKIEPYRNSVLAPEQAAPAPTFMPNTNRFLKIFNLIKAEEKTSFTQSSNS